MWKPDFTKANPWEGMPPDYPGIATFVPSTDPYAKTLPPWEGEAGAEAIPTFNSPEYNALAQRIVDQARVEGNQLIVDSGEKAAVARAQFGYLAEEEEGLPGPAGLGWGALAVIAVIAIVITRRK